MTHAELVDRRGPSSDCAGRVRLFVTVYDDDGSEPGAAGVNVWQCRKCGAVVNERNGVAREWPADERRGPRLAGGD